VKVPELPVKNQLPDADDAPEADARPRRRRKPLDWPTLAIAVLVTLSAALVWRRDGAGGVREILRHDIALFGGILPRVLAGCLLGAFITEILPHEKVSRSLGPGSGLKGLLVPRRGVVAIPVSGGGYCDGDRAALRPAVNRFNGQRGCYNITFSDA
jgi:hypothetical protein